MTTNPQRIERLSSEVRTKFREALADVAAGKEIVVIHYNRPVALITQYRQEGTMNDFDRDPWDSEIGIALARAAGADLDQITWTPDDVWTATRADGARISIGDDGDGGWDATTYGADGEPTGTDNWLHAENLAERVAAFLAA